MLLCIRVLEKMTPVSLDAALASPDYRLPTVLVDSVVPDLVEDLMVGCSSSSVEDTKSLLQPFLLPVHE